jgi:hypothetical protein
VRDPQQVISGFLGTNLEGQWKVYAEVHLSTERKEAF